MSKTIVAHGGQQIIVDDDVYEWASQYSWYLRNGYPVSRMGGRREPIKYLHRVIAGTPKGYRTDHINHNILDNRRCNLRICTPADNSHNMRKPKGQHTSKYKGVSWSQERGKWQTGITVRRHRFALGRYESEEDAARAYDKAAKKYFGEFALTNF